jgi:hypothetical protein
VVVRVLRRTAALGLLSAVVAFAVITARHQSKLRSLWYDESFTIVWLRSDWHEFWQLARRDSGNGIGYVFLLKVLDFVEQACASDRAGRRGVRIYKHACCSRNG